MNKDAEGTEVLSWCLHGGSENRICGASVIPPPPHVLIQVSLTKRKPALAVTLCIHNKASLIVFFICSLLIRLISCVNPT
jgi:hypothetical protein